MIAGYWSLLTEVRSFSSIFTVRLPRKFEIILAGTPTKNRDQIFLIDISRQIMACL